ncbi:MAG TPA: glycine zipper 2TM domain-containing protein [Armatimonadota bacterium]|nr:glycine zipper 2TM domain-containing protein [Armatimonadota bacterium]
MSKKILFCTFTALAFPLVASATEYQTVERPRQQCWNEQVPVQTAGQDYGGAILGGLAGGILGNQVGRGNGRTVATAVGAMTGAVVGDRMSNSGPGYRTVQHCRTVVDLVRVPVIPEPAPVYMQPEPVYVEPAPVIEQRVYYMGGEERHHDMEHRDWHEHREWREHHHHHDDDDD